jgi:hypothetical protein
VTTRWASGGLIRRFLFAQSPPAEGRRVGSWDGVVFCTARACLAPAALVGSILTIHTASSTTGAYSEHSRWRSNHGFIRRDSIRSDSAPLLECEDQLFVISLKALDVAPHRSPSLVREVGRGQRLRHVGRPLPPSSDGAPKFRGKPMETG